MREKKVSIVEARMMSVPNYIGMKMRGVLWPIFRILHLLGCLDVYREITVRYIHWGEFLSMAITFY